MAYAQKLDLTVFRRDPMRLTLAVVGFDLTGSDPQFAVRLFPDAPGSALLTLGTVAVEGAQGIRMVEVTVDGDDVSTSILEIVADKTSIVALPPPSQAGVPVELSYDLQWTAPAEGPGLGAAEHTVLFGDFMVMGSIND